MVPDLTRDNSPTRAPKGPGDGYHLSEDLADQATTFVLDAHVNAPEKPFFMYYAPGCAHAPHHVPSEWADRYAGWFDDGWDAYRETVLDNQKKIGLVPADATLSPRDPDVPEWSTLSADERRLYVRMMEVFAGFVSHADHHFGRLLDTLEQIGELDNTLIMVISDNGASAEGGVTGSFNEMRFFNMVPESFEDDLGHIDDLGGPSSYNHYAWGWAWAGDTPFRRWKRETYRGGTTDPFVLAWPAGMAARGEVRTQYAHAIDMVPTVLDALGIRAPETIRGVPQTPLEGISFAGTFDAADAPSQHVTQYFEMFGHRSIYHDGWRAVCPWPGPDFTTATRNGRAFGSTITPEVLEELDHSGWELYRMSDDPTETRDVAADHPEILRDLIARWWAEAEKYKVLPLDGSAQARLATERPQTSRARTRYEYYPGGSVVPAFAAPSVYNRAYSIEADVEIPAGGAEGVLLAQGGDAGGYSFYVKDGQLAFLYNYVGLDHFEVRSPDGVLTEGHHMLRYEFEPTGKPDIPHGKGVPGRAQLYVDGELVGATEFPYTTPLLFELEGLSCGSDFGAPAAEYEPPFAFTGTIRQVIVELEGELISDDEADLRVLMARD